MAREERVARLDELHDGEMMKVTVGETGVLLVRLEGRVYALGDKCPHHGAPLEEGTLCGGRLLCPWHLSVFEAMEGRMLEPPALDDLARYEVRVAGGEVYVTVPEGASGAVMPEMARPDPERDKRLFVIIGSGAAGMMAAQTLREEGYAGRVMMVSEDVRRPYDRTDCSKGYVAGSRPAEKVYLRPESFYETYGIERVHAEVRAFDAKTRVVELETREELVPDAVLLASGAGPRRLGPDLMGRENVYVLRSMEDAEAIMTAVGAGTRVVLVGASFIAMELAASLGKRGAEITVAAPESAPFERVLGAEVGRWLQRAHEKNGVRFELGQKVREVTGPATRVEQVVLSDGRRVEADVVVVAIGVSPRTEFVRNVDKAGDGAIRVDAQLSCGHGVYAAGDIAEYPDPRTGERARIEHWRLAQQQGRTAARNMNGHNEAFGGVPFFWSVQGKMHFSYVGYAPQWEEVAMAGDLGAGDFTAFYASRGRVLACAGTQVRVLHGMHELYARPMVPKLAELREVGYDPWALMEKAAVR